LDKPKLEKEKPKLKSNDTVPQLDIATHLAESQSSFFSFIFSLLLAVGRKEGRVHLASRLL